MDEDRFDQIVQLVRTIRHDMNNPLGAALGHVQLLLEDPALGEGEVREVLEVVETELRRLVEVVRRLDRIQGEGPLARP
jgi:signal transduction histidine kinase